MSRTRLHLRTPDVGVSYVGSQDFFDRVVAPLLGPLAGRRKRQPAPAGAPATASAPVATGYTPPSDRFGVFQRQCHLGEEDPANRVAAYAFFLWNYEKKEVFGEDEVAGCFRADGMAEPEDASSLYGDLLSRRMLAPGAKDHTWRLTGKGRDYVRHHVLSA